MDRRSLFVSDLDGTLLGDEASLTQWAGWIGRHRERFLLAYASGRFLASVVESLRRTALPQPDAVVGGVGSEIVCYPSGECIWSPVEIVDERWDPDRIDLVLRDVPGLETQPAAYRSRFKISYYLDGADSDRLDEIRRRLRAEGITADIIYSSDRDLDVVPVGVNKGSAVERLARWAGVARGEVFVAGDSGNDLSMFERGYRGIVVANAHPVLRALTGETVYQAGRCHAAGVLEGLTHWMRERHHDEPPRSDISEGHRGSAHERHQAGVQRL